MKNFTIFTVDSQAFWVFLIETTLDFAVRVYDGSLPSDPKIVDQVFQLLMHGVSGALRQGATLVVPDKQPPR